MVGFAKNGISKIIKLHNQIPIPNFKRFSREEPMTIIIHLTWNCIVRPIFDILLTQTEKNSARTHLNIKNNNFKKIECFRKVPFLFSLCVF